MGVIRPIGPGLVIEDFVFPRQRVSEITVDLDMEWWGDRQVELFECRGLEPWQLSCWTHTHPAGINRPSPLDEKTMRESFGGWDMALMLILIHAGDFYCRLEFDHTFALQLANRIRLECPVKTAWQEQVEHSISEATIQEWQEEFDRLVTVDSDSTATTGKKKGDPDWLIDMDEAQETLGAGEEEYDEYCIFYDQQGIDPDDPQAYELWFGYSAPATVRTD